ncbi:MAG: circularly permuted type 2 ATP-grasp protein, partial [Terriglobales bacterium]
MSDAAERGSYGAPASLEPAVGAAGWFDESISGPGARRPHWESLLTSLGRIGREELTVRAESSRRILAEHGVSCFQPQGGGGADVPWRLDLLPLVIGWEEWRALEAGLIQRARLINLILGDLYRNQHLVRNGFVPAPLVFANPGYLRACHGITVKEGAYLQIYTADLGRGPDGKWWVLADRTQAPVGLGFALENRSALSRVLPEAMREVQPRPLLDTFRNRRETLRRLAPPQAENPSIVLLTPGPRNEAYFEHAYLSRLFGLTLVEGEDLTVRDRRLFIKTLEGLRQADVVLRRVNDDNCDPLELNADSLLGVPGLVEAARAGHVSLGNALGTGLLESPAFLPFLAGLCRQLLGEELRLPSLATWWCGQALEQALVRERLGELAVRPAFNLGAPPVMPAELDSTERAELLEQVRLRPHEFVGQERIRLSRAPVWTTNGEGESKPFVLRVFVLHNGSDFIVMPGGLARVVGDDYRGSSALPLSGLSKDVWVLADGGSANLPPLLVSSLQPAFERSPSDLPSRTADNFFWLGRYTERLEQMVRAARQVLRRAEDDPLAPGPGGWAPVAELLSRLGLVPRLKPGEADRETAEILALLFQEGRPGGVRELLQAIHRAA